MIDGIGGIAALFSDSPMLLSESCGDSGSAPSAAQMLSSRSPSSLLNLLPQEYLSSYDFVMIIASS